MSALHSQNRRRFCWRHGDGVVFVLFFLFHQSMAATIFTSSCGRDETRSGLLYTLLLLLNQRIQYHTSQWCGNQPWYTDQYSEDSGGLRLLVKKTQSDKERWSERTHSLQCECLRCIHGSEAEENRTTHDDLEFLHEGWLWFWVQWLAEGTYCLVPGTWIVWSNGEKEDYKWCHHSSFDEKWPLPSNALCYETRIRIAKGSSNLKIQ